jgi:hypothetical protein
MHVKNDAMSAILRVRTSRSDRAGLAGRGNRSRPAAASGSTISAGLRDVGFAARGLNSSSSSW